MANQIEHQARIVILLRSQPMQCLLVVALRELACPDCGPADLAALANQQIAVFEPVTMEVRRSKLYRTQLSSINESPLNRLIPQEGFRNPDILFCIQHFPEFNVKFSSDSRALPVIVKARQARLPGEELLHGGLLDGPLFGQQRLQRSQ